MQCFKFLLIIEFWLNLNLQLDSDIVLIIWRINKLNCLHKLMWIYKIIYIAWNNQEILNMDSNISDEWTISKSHKVIKLQYSSMQYLDGANVRVCKYRLDTRKAKGNLMTKQIKDGLSQCWVKQDHFVSLSVYVCQDDWMTIGMRLE